MLDAVIGRRARLDARVRVCARLLAASACGSAPGQSAAADEVRELPVSDTAPANAADRAAILERSSRLPLFFEKNDLMVAAGTDPKQIRFNDSMVLHQVVNPALVCQ